VVVYPRDVGDCFEILSQLTQEFSIIHGDEKGPRARVLEGVAVRFQGKVEDYFSSFGVGPVGYATGGGLQGKDGEGQRGIQTQKFLSDPFVQTQVVHDNGYAGTGGTQRLRWWRLYRGSAEDQMVGQEVVDLYPDLP
jgi:hypothetical protein